MRRRWGLGGSAFLVGTDGSPLGSFLAVFEPALSDVEMAMVEATLELPYGLK